MKQLHFDTPEEFNKFFKKRNTEVTDSIVEAIKESMQYQKKSAMLFEISFGDEDTLFEISLPKNQWVTALESCLEHYEELELGDQALDTWITLRDVKAW